MNPMVEDHVVKLLEAISFSLERSASAAEATHKLYKQANEDTKRHMQSREEREREQNERSREDFAMAKERHESFMRERNERERVMKRIQEGGVNEGQIIK